MNNLSRRAVLGTAGLGAGALALAACSGGGSGSTGNAGNTTAAANASATSLGGEITWGAWANPGEAKRFNDYATYFQGKYGTKVTFQVVSGDYAAKMLTQLSGGSAPDVFYVGDNLMAKLAENNTVTPMTDYLKSDGSRLKLDDMYTNLMEWCAPKGDGQYYGVTVDCNPLAFWFNKDLLTAAGVAKDPAEQFMAGTWNQEAATDLLTKVKAYGKKGMIFESGWIFTLSWISTLGGKTFDDKGNCVIADDPKSVAALQWVWDQMANKNIIYGGSLPKGQGVDALFYAGELATIQYGRWILPNLKELKFNYDIAPWPSEDGKTQTSIGVYTAAMSVNAKAKNQDLAKAFTGIYCGIEGEKFRLSGGGNAVPACKGLEDVVKEGATPGGPPLPTHGATFNDLAAKGFTIPAKIFTSPELSANLGTMQDKWIKAGVTAQVYAQNMQTYINTGKAPA